MRFLILTFSLLISNSLLSQITFQPTFINQCSNEVDDNSLWVITDSTKANWHWPDNNNSNQATLPKPGNYHIYIDFDDPIEFTVNENGIIADTFFIKRLFHEIYLSKTSSNYFDCENPANGKITDYYFNGKIRMKGTFKKGQPIDTLFSYTRTGQLTEVFIPNKKGWEKINYFKNGKIKSIYNARKKYEKEFYPSGQLKSERYWSRKNKTKLKEYFPNGILKRNQSHGKLKIYNQNKVVVEKIKRKEILIFERLFAKKKYGREKFYTYHWESFDDQGIKKREVVFDNDGFLMSPFPDSIQQIDDFLFEKIIFYFNGKEFKKLALELENRNGFSRKLVVYRKEGKKWVREKTSSMNKIHEMILNYSN